MMKWRMKLLITVVVVFLMFTTTTEAKPIQSDQIRSGEVKPGVVTVVTPRNFYGSGYRKGDRCTITFKGTDRQLVRRYVRKHYKGYKVRFVRQIKGKRTVYVQIVRSRSCGRYGYTKSGRYIRYNIKTFKGKWITSYLIHNPYNDHIEDDVVAVVDNGKVR